MDSKYFDLALKKGVTTALSFIPKAGGMLSKLVDTLWPKPEEDMQRVFKAIEADVRALADELIDNYNADQLRKHTDGFYRLLVNYIQADPKSEEKTHNFNHLYNALDQNQPFFLDIRAPWLNLPHFVSMGTLWLAVLREELDEYETIYKCPNRNYDQKLSKLQSEIEKFSKAAIKIREHCMEWRLGKVKKQDSKTNDIFRSGIYTVSDDMDPSWVKTHRDRPSFQGSSYDAQYDADAELQRRKHYLSHVYGTQLDEHLLPCARWAAFDPYAETPITTSTVPPVLTHDQPVGQGRCSDRMSFFDDRALCTTRGPITRIIIHAGTRVDAIEVFYGGESSGIHGKVGGTAYDYHLEPGEHITQVRGGAGAHLDSIGFSTNLSGEKGLHGGHGGQQYQLGEAASGALQNPRPRLHHVWGFVSSGGIIVQIGFVWAKWPMLDLLAQQEQERPLLPKQQFQQSQQKPSYSFSRLFWNS